MEENRFAWASVMLRLGLGIFLVYAGITNVFIISELSPEMAALSGFKWLGFLVPLPLGTIQLLFGIMLAIGLFTKPVAWAASAGALAGIISIWISSGFSAVWQMIAILAMMLALAFYGCGRLGFDTWLD